MKLRTGSPSESSTIDQNPLKNPNQIDKMIGIEYKYDYEGCGESNELELGLGLSIGGKNGNNNNIPRIFTAKDLPCSRNNGNNNNNNNVVVSPNSSASSCSSLGLIRGCGKSGVTDNNNNNNSNNNSKNVTVGVKRAVSPTAVSQVVGWPPIRSYRMNSMANQAKSVSVDEENSQFDEKEKNGMFGAEDKGNLNSKDRLPHKSSLFVKVNMDGVAIGRKVDLTTHTSYESLAQSLEEMFTNNTAEESNAKELILMPKVTRPSKLLDGTSDFVITYEDKDGDWMLVGDVPWGLFVTTVKRLKIMRTSEANGLTPRSEDMSSKQKRRPI